MNIAASTMGAATIAFGCYVTAVLAGLASCVRFGVAEDGSDGGVSTAGSLEVDAAVAMVEAIDAGTRDSARPAACDNLWANLADSGDWCRCADGTPCYILAGTITGSKCEGSCTYAYLCPSKGATAGGRCAVDRSAASFDLACCDGKREVP